ncbi:hypothetical protein [Georgenia alba]|uniref:Secreted protein n=1 Tax=Georgenia alba TaxID=2233858 RepID=A0ABW2QBY7_9MICO
MSQQHPARPAHRLLVLLGSALVPLATLGGAAAAAPSAPSPAPPPDTIVLVTGDAANGFGIKHHDGTWLYPPTDSEALAECGEYDTRLARQRCRVEVQTWYRDLAAMQQTIDYYRSLGPGSSAPAAQPSRP